MAIIEENAPFQENTELKRVFMLEFFLKICSYEL